MMFDIAFAEQGLDIANKHYVSIGGFTLSADKRRLVVCATIDNLLKGAATQAVQVHTPFVSYKRAKGIDINDRT